MKRYFLRLLVTAVGLVAVLAMPAAASTAMYYVSLGDSLAVGVQPIGPNNTQISTNQGYADQLFTQLQEDNQGDEDNQGNNPDLQLVKLGVSW